MGIRVALYHKTICEYDRPVKLDRRRSLSVKVLLH